MRLSLNQSDLANSRAKGHLGAQDGSSHATAPLSERHLFPGTLLLLQELKMGMYEGTGEWDGFNLKFSLNLLDSFE